MDYTLITAYAVNVLNIIQQIKQHAANQQQQQLNRGQSIPSSQLSGSQGLTGNQIYQNG